MSMHLLSPVFSAWVVLHAFAPVVSGAVLQSGAEVPAVGAWWYTGDAPPAGSTPDLTGVFSGGSSGDLSQSTLEGEEMILTQYGYDRYRSVDHAKDPNTFCVQPGPARMIMMLHPAMIVQRSDAVVILTESQRTFRIIYTDGRPHPPEIYDYPEFMGSSIGHWEGDTLVVETVAINDRTWLDTSGHEHSDQLSMVERFRLRDPNTIEHIVTYTDPVFFMNPFTTLRTFTRDIGDRIMDHSCVDNELDIEHLLPLIGGTGLDVAVYQDEDGNIIRPEPRPEP
jgi:hypothetical protein